MRKKYLIALVFAFTIFVSVSFNGNESDQYVSTYREKLARFKNKQSLLLKTIQESNLKSSPDVEKIKEEIALVRREMKGMDIWLRYMEPLSYKKINGPLPVEWETEVFEKFEKPYRREGAGLTLAALYLDEPGAEKDSLISIV